MAKDPVVVAAQAGDEAAFAALVEPHRRELQVHCYRMLGSLEDSEDVVQETFLRAWRNRESFQGRSSFRAWLYRIATNACLDALDRRPRRVVAARGDTATCRGALAAAVSGRAARRRGVGRRPTRDRGRRQETIELAFIAAIQLLPPKQRAVLISRDVLGWSAAECAALLDMSVAAANSALQRARATLQRHLPRRRLEWAPGSDPEPRRASSCFGATWTRPIVAILPASSSCCAKTRSARCRRSPSGGSDARRSSPPGSKAASAIRPGVSSGACRPG